MKFLAYENFQAKKNQSERKLTILANGDLPGACCAPPVCLPTQPHVPTAGLPGLHSQGADLLPGPASITPSSQHGASSHSSH